MPRKPQRTPAAEAMEQQGYDLSKGTHGGFMGDPEQTTVDPGKKVGKSNWTLSDPTRAYYTAEHPASPDHAEKQGWNWALLAHGDRQAGTRGKRPVVHDVVPRGTVDQDANVPHKGAATANSLRITDTNWIPPAQSLGTREPKVGVQGTLPHVNWNQFAPPQAPAGQTDWNFQNLDEHQGMLKRQKEGEELHGDSPELVAKLTERMRGRTMDSMF
jgi:hypothetical protein